MDDGSSSARTSLAWRDWAAAAALAALVALGVGQRMAPGVVGVIDDDAVYAVTAIALADGRGYHLTNLPGSPPQTKYPVLYPAVASLAARLADGLDARLVAMQRLTAAIGCAALAFAFLYCVRFGLASRGAAFAGGAMVATAPNVLFYCSQTLSEMPFALALVAAMWAVASREHGPPSPRRDFLAGVLLGLPLLCRTAGVMIPVGVVVALAARGRPVRGIAAGSLATALPWFLWVLAATPSGTDTAVAYHTDYFGWWRTNASLTVPTWNLWYAGAGFAQIALEGVARPLYGLTARAGWLLLPLGCLPWIAVAKRAWRLDAFATAMLAYLALLIAWPWPPDRFLVPILPFLASLLVDGAYRVASRVVPARAAATVVGLLVAGAVVTNAAMLSRYASLTRESGYPYFNLPEEPIEWRHFREVFDWLDAHTGPADVVAAGFDTMTSMYTGRPAVRPFDLRPLSLYYGGAEPPLGSVAEFDDALARHGARYMVLTPYSMEAPFFDLVYAASDERPSMLQPVWQSAEDGRFVIFQVVPRQAAR